MSQYAILALWEAENAGILVPPQLWDKAASLFLSVQYGAGELELPPRRAASGPRRSR